MDSIFSTFYFNITGNRLLYKVCLYDKQFNLILSSILISFFFRFFIGLLGLRTTPLLNFAVQISSHSYIILLIALDIE